MANIEYVSFVFKYPGRFRRHYNQGHIEENTLECYVNETECLVNISGDKCSLIDRYYTFVNQKLFIELQNIF